ncbi:MAG: alpha/beta fold hydrolase [Candidatus Latescibacteria bacterium]|nr:alpha/beta fold hydrolase [Candidatus Latescibacterota bacterium]
MTETKTQKELVILVHGFCRTHRDMKSLKNNLESYGHRVVSPDFPTFTGTLEECSKKLGSELNNVKGTYDCVHLVGHSLGGLIIRQYLANNKLSGLGRCVLIGTPNKGTELAGIVDRFIKPLVWIFKPYRVLKPGGRIFGQPINNPLPEIAAIAGDKNRLLFGGLIKRENDGRVPVASVPFEGMKEFIVLPYHHEEIHHKKLTARYVHNFLQNGTFAMVSDKNDF